MSKHIKNEACPRCRADGHDKSGDNLSRYSDGSAWCFKCHYYIMPDNIISNYIMNKTPKPLPKVLLPSDAGVDYPDKCLAWMDKYNISKDIMLKHGILFSSEGVNINVKGGKYRVQDLLLFPFWNDGDLLGWQGRYFGNVGIIPKWISKGDVKSILHIVKKRETVTANIKSNTQLFLVEDIVSAIKLSMLGFDAMPLFGVDVKGRISQFRVLSYLEYVIFLDADMHKHSVLESNVMRLNGFKVHSILSECDPKEYTFDELRRILA